MVTDHPSVGAEHHLPMTATASRCLNCGTVLTDAFCPHCGQKASVDRLSVKTAIIDNVWSALRMDKTVLPTAFRLLTKPWVVIRDYIHGRRIVYTQPMKFIVIICFINILVQVFLPDTSLSQDTNANHDADLSAWRHLLTGIQSFIRDSEIISDLIDSIIFVPIVYLIYLPWGGRRFNFAEYSTAFLYLCGANLAMDLVTMPIDIISDDLSTVISIVWWIYLFIGLVKHSFNFGNQTVRIFVTLINVLIILSVEFFNQVVLLGEQIDI